jgi:hypothetical protein
LSWLFFIASGGGGAGGGGLGCGRGVLGLERFPGAVKKGHAGRHEGRGTITVRWRQVGVSSFPALDRRGTDGV